MSYDIWLEVNTGGPESACIVGANDWNYTANCSPMWRKAGADLAEFDGKPAGESARFLRSGIGLMRMFPAEYMALDPPNGWGSYDSLVPALERLLAMFERHPLATVRVSR